MKLTCYVCGKPIPYRSPEALDDRCDECYRRADRRLRANANAEAATYKRLVNGGWGCTVEGIRFKFFRPTPGTIFHGVDYKGDWHCKVYLPDGDEMAVRSKTREEAISEVLEEVYRAAEA